MSMSVLEQGPTVSTHYTDWHRCVRPRFTVECRNNGSIDMLAASQPEGAFPDPAADEWRLQVITGGDVSGHVDAGAGLFSFNQSAGHLLITASNESTDHILFGDHAFVSLSLPAVRGRQLIEEVAPEFSGHFGDLHSCLWRDNAIRAFSLLIWRASKGDRHAPDLDPDEALMRLALMLLKRSNERFTPKDFAYRLAPAVRRRVTEFVNDHIDEDLPLFLLAKVAGLSPYHFARCFRADMGDTPAQYVTRRRLAKAQDLIRDTDRPFTEIAMEAGFSSQSRLNDAFAREIGGTPTQMRREVRG